MPAGWSWLTWSLRRWVSIARLFIFSFFLAWVSHSGPSVCGTKDLEEEMSEMLVLIVSYSRHL